jgi:NADH-quinone oxidoreductase subunit L
MLLSVGIASLGIWGAWTVYLKRKELAERFRTRYRGMHRILWNKYYVDEAYDFLFVRPTVRLSELFLWKWFDTSIIDGAVNGSATLMNWCAKQVRRAQTGVAQMYAVVFVGGIIVVLIWIVFT